MGFQGQHAMVTGGSSGIGKALAQQLVEAGAHLTLIARTATRLAAVQAELEVLRPDPAQRIMTLTADVCDRTQVDATLAQVIPELGPPDLLITCAGMAHPGYFAALPIEVFEQTMAVNYFGTLYYIKAVLPLMRQRQSGHIVLVSSGVGLMGIFGYTPYSPSKFALRGLAESLRGELRGSGVQFAIAYPPDTDTPQLAAENLTKPSETRAIAATSATWSAERVAASILQGIQHRQFMITPGWEMTLLARFHSLLAPLLQRYFDHLATQVQTRNHYP